MTARFAALLPRLFALTAIGLIGASSLTFAAATKKIQDQEAAAKPVQAGPNTLRVPDVRGQAYVFAKGILEDAGFSWQVAGRVEGYAANLVSVQNPAPGTKVLDTGAPTVELRLERNPDYGERGLPVNTSSYDGTKLRLASDPAAEARSEEPKEETPSSDEPAPGDGAEEPKEDKPAQGDDPKASDGREPDFVVAGAPAEPRDEMPLPNRARLVEKRIGAAAKPSRRLVNWWLYQHEWIVTGARFGWHDGAAALRILIRVDRSIERRWGFGARSTVVAKRALAEVERKAPK
jgi:PASTA domain-containing protein